MEIFDLKDCEIRLTNRYDFALEIVNTRSAFRIGHFQLFLIFPAAAKCHKWLRYLVSQGILPIRPPHTFESIWAEQEARLVRKQRRSGKVPASNHSVENFLHFYGAGEQCSVFNHLLNRWFRSMREGPTLVTKLRQKIAQKMASKLFEKGLDESFSHLRLLEVRIEDSPPIFHVARLHQFGIDLELEYTGGIFFSFCGKLYIKALNRRMDIRVAVTVARIAGCLTVHLHPHEGDLIAVSFREKPDLQFNLDVKLGAVPEFFDIRKFIINKIKASVYERFVAPNRKYIRIPKTHKSFWELLDVRMRAVEALGIHYAQQAEDPAAAVPAGALPAAFASLPPVPSRKSFRERFRLTRNSSEKTEK